MAAVSTKVALLAETTDVFEVGSYTVTDILVPASVASKVPVNLFVVAPITKGTYPVLLFCHGFMMTNTTYSDLLHHIASHGYIIVAPQFDMTISIPTEIRQTTEVAQWICSTTGLTTVLPQMVSPDIENLVLSGHSRGGKTAFALALGKISSTNKKRRWFSCFNFRRNKTSPQAQQVPKFKALIGIDPVAGTSPTSVPDPKILKYIPRSFELSIPIAVIGTGLGHCKPSMPFAPPCAPDGVNHSEFFNESKPPACYFLAKEYGHCDMLDDSFWNLATSLAVKSGNGPKDLMRKGVGGVVVAFLRAYLGADHDMDLNAIVNNPSIAPIVLDPVIHVKE